MVKEVLPLTAGALVPFKKKMMILELKLIILLGMVEMWSCDTSIECIQDGHQ